MTGLSQRSGDPAGFLIWISLPPFALTSPTALPRGRERPVGS